MWHSFEWFESTELRLLLLCICWVPVKRCLHFHFQYSVEMMFTCFTHAICLRPFDEHVSWQWDLRISYTKMRRASLFNFDAVFFRHHHHHQHHARFLLLISPASMTFSSSSSSSSTYFFHDSIIRFHRFIDPNWCWRTMRAHYTKWTKLPSVMSIEHMQPRMTIIMRNLHPNENCWPSFLSPTDTMESLWRQMPTIEFRMEHAQRQYACCTTVE